MSLSRVPKYRRHPNGQAFVQHRSIANKSRRLYLGRHGSEESRRRYRQFLQRLEANQPTEVVGALSDAPTIWELSLLYDDYAKVHYDRGGERSTEYRSMWEALRILLSMYGDEPASGFGPKALRLIQQKMATDDSTRRPPSYARSHINHTTSRVKRFFKWAAREELIAGEVYHRLLCVGGLQKGEFNAREAVKVRPAADGSIRAVLPYLSPTVATLAQVQHLCGMRPGEACIMRPCDLDRSGEIWLYAPESHKNAWRDLGLIKAIPRRAQTLLAPFLDGRHAEAYLFSPAEALAWSKEKRASQSTRKTKRFPCEVRRLERDRCQRQNRKQKRPIRDHYTKDSYRQALDYGFKHAKAAGVDVERFTPNQLRHAMLNFISKHLGHQKAQCYAGHETMETTAIYTEKDVAELVDVANQLDAFWQSAS